MISLDKDLQKIKMNLDEFGEVATRVLQYLPNVLSSSEEKKSYIIYSSQIAGTTKYIRPINKNLFFYNPADFTTNFAKLKAIFTEIKNGSEISFADKAVIDKTIYTIQQSIGAGLDLLVNPNSARKHVGNRFEEVLTNRFENAVILLKVFFFYSIQFHPWHFGFLKCDPNQISGF